MNKRSVSREHARAMITDALAGVGQLRS
jgi:hypothetical protein